MLILAIDTTGFSASIAIVKNGMEVLYNKIDSYFLPNTSWDKFTYLLPKHHLNFLLKNIDKSLKKLNFSWSNVDAIAVSAESGIYNCILVGLTIAETLAQCHNKPLIEVDHILAHAYSTWLEQDSNRFKFPILIFSASGSHSDFSLIKSKSECEVIFDTVPHEKLKDIKIFLGLGKVFYRMGRTLGVIHASKSGVDQLIKSTLKGDPYKYNFSKYHGGPLLNLNFSSLVLSVEKFFEKEKKKKEKLPQSFINDVAASFQETITEILTDKIFKLAKMKKVKEIHIAGGISENKYLQKKLKNKITKEKMPYVLRYPVKKEYRLDNAAMIGCLAYYQKKYNIKFKNFKPNITR